MSPAQPVARPAAPSAALPAARAVAVPSAVLGRPAQRGFTFVELLVALGIMAFGASVALGLVTLATRTHRRAIDRTNAALLADAVAAEVRGTLTGTVDLTQLPPATQATGALLFRSGGRHPGFEDYVYDVVLSPIDDPDPDLAEGFLVEITVRWKASGQARTQAYHTVATRQLRIRDL